MITPCLFILPHHLACTTPPFGHLVPSPSYPHPSPFPQRYLLLCKRLRQCREDEEGRGAYTMKNVKPSSPCSCSFYPFSACCCSCAVDECSILPCFPALLELTHCSSDVCAHFPVGLQQNICSCFHCVRSCLVSFVPCSP